MILLVVTDLTVTAEFTDCRRSYWLSPILLIAAHSASPGFLQHVFCRALNRFP